MKIQILNNCGADSEPLVRNLVAELDELGFDVSLVTHPIATTNDDSILVEIGNDIASPSPMKHQVALYGRETLLERVLRAIPLDFDQLPLLVEGESKIIRLWTDRVVVERFKPTVYSYTTNRYGEAEGTDIVRIQFTAELFRRMAQLSPAPCVPRSAFLAEIDTSGAPLLVQRRVETCNIEARVKRFHIGSPVHRYLYTENYSTTQTCGPLRRWSRLDRPVVCFDWRHPVRDAEGHRLADEPISDDYAAIWMYNVEYAKEMARQTFLWMEKMFAASGVLLVDMCIFIDRSGKLIYGEISPDCMRVRLGLEDPSQAESLDKDLWRTGRSSDELRRRYEYLYQLIFGTDKP